jgi:hypothetical protein
LKKLTFITLLSVFVHLTGWSFLRFFKRRRIPRYFSRKFRYTVFVWVIQSIVGSIGSEAGTKDCNQATQNSILRLEAPLSVIATMRSAFRTSERVY